MIVRWKATQQPKVQMNSNNSDPKQGLNCIYNDFLYLPVANVPSISSILEGGLDSLSCELSGDCEDAYGDDEQILPETPPSFVTLPRQVLFHAGLESEEGPDVIRYIRPRCVTQMHFMWADIVRYNHIGHIYGQPGTGKSTTALYCAMRFAKEKKWNVLWAHLCAAKRSGYWKCVHIRPDGKLATASVSSSDISHHIDHFHTLAPPSFEVSGHLIILDGIDSQSPDWFGDLWADSAPNRRLIRIFSDGVNCGLTGSERDEGRIRIFNQWSWTLNEYLCVIQNEEFCRNVQVVLDASSDAQTVDEKIKAKYCVAGGSARWMFGRKADFVKRSIDSAIKRIPIDASISDTRLFSRFGRNRTEVVSDYAKWSMANELGSMESERLSQHPLVRQSDACRCSLDSQ
jgi:hypothetical protein